MRAPLAPSSIAASLALLASCAASPAAGPDAAAARQQGSLAAVRLTRDATAALAAPGDVGAVVQAVFARFEGTDGAGVARILDLPPAAGAEECMLAGVGSDLPLAGDAVVELLEAGELTLGLAGDEASLAPQAFPDLGALVSGAFYAADVVWPATTAWVDDLSVRFAGSADVPSLETLASIPRAPDGVRLDGRDAGGRLAVGRTEGVTIEWEPGDPHDAIELEVAAAGARVRCTAEDAGAFVVPGDLLASLPPARDARMVLRRLRVQPLELPLSDGAWLTVAAERRFELELH